MFVRLSAAIAAASLLSVSAFAQGAKPTDPQIAHIAYTAGVIDIAAAKQALAKTSNKEVKAFAEDMVRDHEAVNKQALDLVKNLKVTSADNDTSRALTKQAADKNAELAKLNGAAKCATCHVPPLFTEPGRNLHAPSEIGIDSFQADRSPTHMYRTAPLAGLWTHQKGGFFHDGRFATLLDVVNHYNTQFNLDLTNPQKNDLIEYLKGI